MGNKYNPSSMNKLLSWERDIGHECRNIALAALKGDDGSRGETLGAIIHNCLRWAHTNPETGQKVGMPLDLVGDKDQALLVMIAAAGFSQILELAYDVNLPGKGDDPVRVFEVFKFRCAKCGADHEKKALHDWGMTVSLICKCGHAFRYTPKRYQKKVMEIRKQAQAELEEEHPMITKNADDMPLVVPGKLDPELLPEGHPDKVKP